MFTDENFAQIIEDAKTISSHIQEGRWEHVTILFENLPRWAIAVLFMLVDVSTEQKLDLARHICDHTVVA